MLKLVRIAPFFISAIVVGCSDGQEKGEQYDMSEVVGEGDSLNSGSDNDGESSDSDSDVGSGSDDGASDDDGTPEEDAPTVDERTFAKKLVVSMLMPGVFNPDNLDETRTTSFLLVDWVRTGTDVTWTEELCHISATEVHGNQTEFPSAFVSTMPIREHHGVLSEAEVGATFSTDTFVNIDGVELDNPATDSLPTRSGDSRVWDQDSDGEPGITVSIDAGWPASGDIYLVQRSEFAYEGIVVAQDRVEVYVDYNQEQSILGASNPVLTMADVVPIPNPTPATSYAIFQQIDEDLTCGYVKSNRGTLFD